jgi:hypothetical protein
MYKKKLITGLFSISHIKVDVRLLAPLKNKE